MSVQFYTYLHCKPDGTPFYVGKGTGNRAFRFDGKNRNQYHKNTANKYGKENIKIFIFACDSEDQAFADEILQIEQLRKSGYALANLANGGEGASGYRHTEAAKRKIAEKAANPSEETKQKWTKARKGVLHSEEWKRKISESHKGKIQGPMHENTRKALFASRIGKPLTEEHKAKTAAGLIGNKNALGHKHSDEAKLRMSEAAYLRNAKMKGKVL